MCCLNKKQTILAVNMAYAAVKKNANQSIVNVDGINGSAGLHRLLTCDNVLPQGYKPSFSPPWIGRYQDGHEF